MAIIQWVNLKKRDIYTNDSDIDSINRCGALTFEAEFAKDNVPLSFKTLTTAAWEYNAVYSEEEKNRNKNFRSINDVPGLATERKFVMDEAIKFPAAGGNRYIIEAKDANGTIVSSLEVETMRKLYYQALYVDETNGGVEPNLLAAMESHGLKHYIKLEKKGGNKKMPYFKAITLQENSGNYGLFAREAIKASDLDPDHKMVGFIAVFSNYIASMKKDVIEVEIKKGKRPPAKFALTPTEVILTGDNHLWHGLDEKDDRAKRWFDSGLISNFNPETGFFDHFDIEPANVDIAGNPDFPYGGYKQIKIKRDAALNHFMSSHSGIFQFFINVHIPAWTNGCSLSTADGDGDVITTARRVMWRDRPINDQKETWIHELGHRLGMTAYGNKLDYEGNKVRGSEKLPDRPSTLYSNVIDNKNYGGHKGPHCSNGMIYNEKNDSWSGTAKCVMFGSSGYGRADDYCPECGPIVRKLDLS